MPTESTSGRISAVINTYNAERFLPRCLEALKGFDEILVCDMESTDSTVAIARDYGCSVVTFPKGDNSICEPARDFAIHSAANDWVLVVDADEVVTPELRSYLYSLIASPDCPNGLCIPRKNHMFGVFLVFDYPDYQLRFFRKSAAYWPPFIHSRPQIQGAVRHIPRGRKDLALAHYPDVTETEKIRKLNTYSDSEALVKKKGRKVSFAALVFSPFNRFFRAYVLRGGFRSGRLGFVIAANDAIYKFLILAKLFEAECRAKHSADGKE